MRSACAIGLGLAVLFAGGSTRAQEERTKAKSVPSVSIVVIEVQPGQVAGPVQYRVTIGERIGQKPEPSGTAPAIAPATIKGHAPSPAAPHLGPFRAMDTDKDGKISRSEFKGPPEVFAWVDADHDGSITQPEATHYLAFIGLMSLQEKARAFQAMDTNKDGKVGPAEFKGSKVVFARLDADHDGLLTKDEVIRGFHRRVHRAMVVARLRAIDANHDGSISAAEFQGSVPEFVRLDVDHDGAISRAELAKVFHAARGRQAAQATKAVAPAPKTVAPATATKVVQPIPSEAASHVAEPVTLGPSVNRVLAMDTNKDGKVCKDEYMKGLAARFAYLDQDKDGYITATDIVKVVQARRSNPARAIKPVPAGKTTTTAEHAAKGVKTAGVAKKP